ncbi:MAG: hypothetical protein GKR88_10950 [Flavobacteriaceae bacterium]|nr:MAG: hypothetical protein GKR88_10950 [Flavobacteriaceae bacterium]
MFKRIFSCVIPQEREERSGISMPAPIPETPEKVNLSKGISELSGKSALNIPFGKENNDFNKFSYVIRDKNNNEGVPETPTRPSTELQYGRVSHLSKRDSMSKVELEEKTDVIVLHNAQSGSAAVKIDFDDIEEEHPVLVTTGSLSGCTVLFGADDHAFYAFHTGKATHDTAEWKTNKQGVERLFDTYKEFNGNTSLSPEDERGEDINSFLDKIINELGSGIAIHNSKETTDPGGPAEGSSRVKYNTNAKRGEEGAEEKGIALALIRRKEGEIIIEALAHRLTPNSPEGEGVQDSEKEPIRLK